MDKRIAMSVATGVVVALPLLAACGAGSAPQGSSAAPPATSAAAPSTTAAAPSATPSTSASASASASPSSNPADEKKNAQDATEKFITTALTIGYPDKSFDEYTKRIKPLMTSRSFASFKKSTTVKQGDKALKKLSSERARISPKIKSDKVTSISADKATVKITYQSRTQQKAGGDWKTLQTSSAESDDVKLVRDGDAWLVDNLS
jgi:hypothetical protein